MIVFCLVQPAVSVPAILSFNRVIILFARIDAVRELTDHFTRRAQGLVGLVSRALQKEI